MCPGTAAPAGDRADPGGLADLVEALSRRAVLVPDATAHAVAADLVRVAYRLLLGDLAARRGAEVERSALLEGLELVAVREVDLALAVPFLGADAGALGALHEQLLTLEPVLDDGVLRLEPRGRARKAAGAWFTPQPLVDHLLDLTLDPVLEERTGPVEVLDPACGAGIFLVAAARRIAERTGDLHAAVTRHVHGVDLDPVVLELARVCLWLELVEPGKPLSLPPLRLDHGDALSDALAAGLRGHDVVVGNPPFLNQLETLTVRAGAGYTDVSARFLDRSLDWLVRGGRVGLVQPQSLLAARDAGPVRSRVAATSALEALWASDVPVFDAGVLTCAPVLRKGAVQGEVRRSHGPAFTPLAPREVTADELAGEWSFLLVEALGVPEVALTSPRTLGDLAVCTADFRDQYYGLDGHVHEAAARPDAAPLVTSGLIDPAECRWGRAGTRFLKRRWDAPVVDVAGLTPALQRWARTRLVPKVLVGTQGKVVEAVVDEHGAWLPSVPVISVLPAADDLWRVLAVLLAPPVTAHAVARYAGTALSMHAVKLSASQVARLPLPTVEEPWAAATSVVRRAQADPEARPALLREAGALMCAAYEVDVDAVLPWWEERLTRRR